MPKQKGKLDRSASVTIGGTIYNVHPKVRSTMDGMYKEYIQMAKVFNDMHPFEEKERALLNKIVTIFEPMPDIPKELVGIIQDIKDLMKAAAPEPPAEATVEPKKEDNGSQGTPTDSSSKTV